MVADVKVYTVNGATAGSSSSLPDWLTRKRTAAKGKGKRAAREHYEGTIELIQGFEFPEASIRLKSTRDGHHVIATGVYKPQMRVWDLDQLTLKFERHSDAENVDFVLLSDDWTKSIHLQNDRTVELHTQGGFHYRTRVPRFGRSIGYHFPSCDAYITASGSEVYRLNLEQGRFMNPLVLADDSDIAGVNVVDINPAHQLLAFGLDGSGTTQFWDPRSRSSVGTLRLPPSILSHPGSDVDLSVSAIASRADGLTYAIGTSTGHTLLYDIRSSRHFALKDQGYGLPVKRVTWVGGGSKMAGDGMVITADKKVVKIWDRITPDTNFASITPANDLNDLHHIPGSGLLMTANEGIQMATYYIPALGPAPRWASFLENITEEMEDQTTRSVYEDFKFIERTELANLGLDHLVGTPALKPYMHGYFVSLKLYDAARVIANPYAYQEHREKVIKEKMDKMAETRIRARKDASAGVKVNKALAERILKDEEKARKKEEKRKARKAAEAGDDMEVDGVDGDEDAAPQETQSSILNDPRFAAVFENPAFAIDESSWEYAMLHPAAADLRTKARPKTAVEDEEEESDKMSSDGLCESESEPEGDSDGDSSGDEYKKAAAARQEAYRQNLSGTSSNRAPKVNMVPVRAQSSRNANTNKDATFGQRRSTGSSGGKFSRSASASNVRKTADGGMEMSWTPATSGPANDDDMLVPNAPGRPPKNVRRKKPGLESFGAGMEKGGMDHLEAAESERKGRSKRRIGMRSGSKNAFRKL